MIHIGRNLGRDDTVWEHLVRTSCSGLLGGTSLAHADRPEGFRTPSSTHYSRARDDDERQGCSLSPSSPGLRNNWHGPSVVRRRKRHFET